MKRDPNRKLVLRTIDRISDKYIRQTADQRVDLPIDRRFHTATFCSAKPTVGGRNMQPSSQNSNYSVFSKGKKVRFYY